MPGFKTYLAVAPNDDETSAKLVYPLVYESASGRVFTVPAGFDTDFASVPRILWAIVPPTGKYGRGAVVHDYLYRTQILTRAESDAIFLEAMEATNVSYCERYTIYWAVRSWGWIAWRNNKKHLVKP